MKSEFTFSYGFIVLSETADVIYKCTDFYVLGNNYGILWVDPTKLEYPAMV